MLLREFALGPSNEPHVSQQMQCCKRLLGSCIMRHTWRHAPHMSLGPAAAFCTVPFVPAAALLLPLGARVLARPDTLPLPDLFLLALELFGAGAVSSEPQPGAQSSGSSSTTAEGG